MRRLSLTALLFFGLLLAPATAQKKKKAAAASPTPTVANLHYGPHERQVLDFYKAKSDQPTPLVFYIHGGGWQAGDKDTLGGPTIKRFLDAGISVAAINYRYVK